VNDCESLVPYLLRLWPPGRVSIVASVTVNPKRVLGTVSPQPGASAIHTSVSLYPAHYETLNQRTRELNIGRSALLQMLVEIEQRQGLLRPELLRRLRRHGNNNNNNTAQKETNDHIKIHQLANQ
jgi:hypothetical protein